eukprot:jgi/Bigna1/49930/estExt_Genewise1.C_610033
MPSKKKTKGGGKAMEKKDHGSHALEQESRIPLSVVAGVVAATAVAIVPALSFTPKKGLTIWSPIPLATNVVLSGLGCLGTMYVIPHFREKFIKARLFGIDLNKMTTARDEDGVLIRPYQGPKVPEAMGVISGMIFLIVMFLYIPFAFAGYYATPKDFPHHKLTEFVAALLSIACMCFLGFADNVLDLRWRHKLLLPTAATLPLLMVYWVNGGVTYVMVPNFLQPMLGGVVNLGILYYIYMGMLAVFCTNAINILAGVNGLEAGQSLIIGASILANSLLQITRLENPAGVDNHVFAVVFMVPFLATTFALTYHNWYPSRVFVGDTFCYFAGMTFAVVAILGHFSKTLLLFFIPQIANFLYSCPQLFKMIPCPRHRMPSLDPKSGKIDMSYCEFTPDELPSLGRLIYKILKVTRMVKVVEHKDGTVKMNNLTLINWSLYAFGPMREDWLTICLLTEQAVCSCVAFLIRYKLAAFFYKVVE